VLLSNAFLLTENALPYTALHTSAFKLDKHKPAKTLKDLMI